MKFNEYANIRTDNRDTRKTIFVWLLVIFIIYVVASIIIFGFIEIFWCGINCDPMPIYGPANQVVCVFTTIFIVCKYVFMICTLVILIAKQSAQSVKIWKITELVGAAIMVVMLVAEFKEWMIEIDILISLSLQILSYFYLNEFDEQPIA